MSSHLHGLALTVANGELVTYLVYLVGAVVIAGIAVVKWCGRMFEKFLPMITEFFDDHKTTMSTARDVMVKMGDTTAVIQDQIGQVHQTLGKHGEKLDVIERRTQQLERTSGA